MAVQWLMQTIANSTASVSHQLDPQQPSYRVARLQSVIGHQRSTLVI